MSDEALTERERRVLRAATAQPSGALSPEHLADWLAGRADAATAKAVERALAADAALRDGVVAAREGLSEPASAAEIIRARALVGTIPPRAQPSAARWIGWLVRPVPAASLTLAATGCGLALGFAASASLATGEAATLASAFGFGSLF